VAANGIGESVKDVAEIEHGRNFGVSMSYWFGQRSGGVNITMPSNLCRRSSWETGPHGYPPRARSGAVGDRVPLLMITLDK